MVRTGVCDSPDCMFAHRRSELRPLGQSHKQASNYSSSPLPQSSSSIDAVDLRADYNGRRRQGSNQYAASYLSQDSACYSSEASVQGARRHAASYSSEDSAPIDPAGLRAEQGMEPDRRSLVDPLLGLRQQMGYASSSSSLSFSRQTERPPAYPLPPGLTPGFLGDDSDVPKDIYDITYRRGSPAGVVSPKGLVSEALMTFGCPDRPESQRAVASDSPMPAMPGSEIRRGKGTGGSSSSMDVPTQFAEALPAYTFRSQSGATAHPTDVPMRVNLGRPFGESIAPSGELPEWMSAEPQGFFTDSSVTFSL